MISHEEETLLHLFWECPAVQSFWSDVMISRDIQVELNMPLILFCLDQNVQTDRRFDLIILMAEFHIFKSKLQKGGPNFNIFIHSLKQRAVTEKYRIAASDEEERHETQPLSLADLLCLKYDSLSLSLPTTETLCVCVGGGGGVRACVRACVCVGYLNY